MDNVLNPFKLSRIPRHFTLPEGFYEVAYRLDEPLNTYFVHLRHKKPDKNGEIRSYFISSPNKDGCADYGQYSWRKMPNQITQYARPLLPFEVIEVKFGLYSWNRV